MMLRWDFFVRYWTNNRGVTTGLNEFALMQMNLLNLHAYVGVSKIYDYSMNLLSFKEVDIIQMNITINALNV
jgi:hypothetical protein